KIDTNDFETKLRHARKFIEHGDRVKVSMFFRGREFSHKEFGEATIKKFQERMEDIAKIEIPMSKEGRSLVIVLSKK
ncbi:translation initiation factor IF-3, partial [candidate division KSB1 bacterium]